MDNKELYDKLKEEIKKEVYDKLKEELKKEILILSKVCKYEFLKFKKDNIYNKKDKLRTNIYNNQKKFDELGYTDRQERKDSFYSNVQIDERQTIEYERELFEISIEESKQWTELRKLGYEF